MKINCIMITCVVFMLTTTSVNLLSQSFYVKAEAGYGFKTSSQNSLYFPLYDYTIDSLSSSTEHISASLGKGMNLGGAFGYMFTDNLGVELGLSYLYGSKSKAKHQYIDATVDFALYSRMFRINPTLIVSLKENKINLYSKFGVIMALGAIYYEKSTAKHNGDNESIKIKLSGDAAFGFNAGLGVMYPLNNSVSLFGEVNLISLSYAPSRGEVTEATINGVDQLPLLSTRDKEFEFVDEFVSNSYNPDPDDKPKPELKHLFPFGSIGLNAGIKVTL
ncbi:MAG: outer membrane beta-barrel protein [Bacteroidales bacterium]